MKTTINNSFEDFKKTLSNSIELQQEFQTDPIKALNNFEVKNPKETDSWIYRIIVLMLGLSIIAIIVGLILLAFWDRRNPDSQLITIFATISSGAISALAGLLAPSPNK
ncbi:hypothetical protein PGH12_14420 [Chryseobacterium wangxinyae]|uniref:hypothetical protein n=1 Tax=Chryseobacterium sp. CY350 TaxID=2997336 RepID=UPI00227171BC|nr:hypothetical protein [Chryseobacterium sp. CY350]MCY0975733.1 hypothetical protein [Chryseobacterium sp. CY350]WBZ94657.1 hypothetical protein PGH12_14420 [Chryseobacterium sp. CY350]